MGVQEYYDLPCCLVAMKLMSKLGLHSLAVVLVIDWRFLGNPFRQRCVMVKIMELVALNLSWNSDS